MSVLIKGMEMPTRCEDCFCFRRNAEYDYAYCNISSANVLGHGNERLNNCPLVEIPPHGRLIDADELRALYDFDGYDDHGEITREDFDRLLCRLPVIRQNIDDMPTIIEAEEAE